MNAWQLSQAVCAVREGGLIAYPTEAVFGLGCDPRRHASVLRLLALKRRPLHKGLILIASEWRQLETYLAPLDPPLRSRISATWPGPVTWVLPAGAAAPGWLTGGQPGLAVRIPAHPLCQALCRALGHPLVSTSANPSGRPPARSALRVRRLFPKGIDYILPGALGGRTQPSAIFDACTGQRLR